MEEGGCAGEHCLGDCGVDVLLGRLGDILEDALSNASGEESKYEGTVSWRDSKDDTRRAGLQGGTLRGVYRLIKEGQFDCNASGIAYEAIEDISTAPILKRLKDAVRNELDCQVCYTLILDPLTTHCGHTFCRKCVALLLNHSDLCPVCRRKLNMPSRIQEEPMNKQIAGLMRTLIPDQVAAAQSAIAQEEEGDTNNNNQTVMPLFVGTASFPTMPIFLHIFEPRYRIMIRRIMESREHKFGMVAFNRARRRQGGLGRSQFMQHGTMMMVERFELLPDGRSLVIATGVSRFKVMKSDMVDGYHVGHIERLDDIPVSEEERREAAETLSMNDSVQPSAEGAQPERPIDAMPTQEIFDTTLDFVRKQHREGASWLHPRALLAFGNEPTDPSLFPWWFASILNVSDEDKYTVLCATSVRERLKVAAHWAKKLEAREWYAFPSQTLLFKKYANILNRPTRPSISSVL